MTEASPTSPGAPGLILLPSDRFFVRAVPLAAGADVAAQVELAVESLAPFPLGQLYYGFLPAATGGQALVFAAYRKRFSAAETAEWGPASAVVPAFLIQLGEPPPTPGIRLCTEPRTITALAWDGATPLPVAVLAREADPPSDPALRAALVAEIRTRTGLATATVEEAAGPATAGWVKEKGSMQLELADVRDKGFLAARRTQQKRDRMLWRGFLAGLGGLAAMLALEGGVLAGGIWRQSLQASAARQAPAVQAIETAQALSARVEEMTRRRLLPFEMLALINQRRPASVQFIRTSTTGLHAMEVEAQAANAADVGQYESALRLAPELAGVEIRDLRSRDGLTTFTLAVAYKPESLRREERP